MPETVTTMILALIHADTGETVLEVDVDDDRLRDDHALIAETAEQVIADEGIDYRVTFATTVGVKWIRAVAYVETIA